MKGERDKFVLFKRSHQTPKAFAALLSPFLDLGLAFLITVTNFVR